MAGELIDMTPSYWIVKRKTKIEKILPKVFHKLELLNLPHCEKYSRDSRAALSYYSSYDSELNDVFSCLHSILQR